MKIKEWIKTAGAKLPKLSDKLSFFRLEPEPEEEGADEHSDETDAEYGAEDSMEERIWHHRVGKRRRYAAAAVCVVLAILGFAVYNRLVTYDAYVIAATYENIAASGTSYAAVGNNILKYNADGITCVTKNNDLRWNVTYSMQSAVADICDSTMAVAEQHGNQVYIVNEDGELGHFETVNPILKVRVSRQGVAAVVLQEDDVTWVNLYQSDGTLIASDKTTMLESGYPLDVDISPDGKKIVVSYLQISGGVLSSSVTFYQFGSGGQQLENHVAASETYDGMVIPEVYFTDNSTAVALSDSGYMVFEGSSSPRQTEEVTFEQEIISCFHEDETVGFVFDSENDESAYRIALYNLRGREKASCETDFSYSSIKMENGQILMYNDSGLAVYTSGGHLRFQSEYEKEVRGFYYFSEYRRYLVITSDSFDRIRIVSGG